MILLDVNILVTAHREDAERHKEVRAWLEAKLAEPGGVAVSELVLSGSLRVITHPRVFEVPTPLESALAFVADFRSRPEVHLLAPGSEHWQIFLDLCRSSDARGNLVPDAYHAALALEHACTWATLDRGFRRFPKLRCLHPLEENLR